MEGELSSSSFFPLSPTRNRKGMKGGRVTMDKARAEAVINPALAKPHRCLLLVLMSPGRQGRPSFLLECRHTASQEWRRKGERGMRKKERERERPTGGDSAAPGAS